MKKMLKRQVMAALAVTAMLGAAGGMTAHAAFNAGTILASEADRDKLAAGSNQYFYGVTGGNAYLDNNAKDLVGDINGVVNYQPDGTATNLPIIENMAKDKLAEEIRNRLPEEVTGTIDAIDSKTVNGSGTQTINKGTTLKLNGYEGKDWVRYYGAIGGDAAVDTGLTGQLDASATVMDRPLVTIGENYAKQDKTVIDRTGDVTVNVGSEKGAVSVIGGVGGSAAMAVGNLTMDMSQDGVDKNVTVNEQPSITATIHANVQDVALQGDATTRIHGNVTTTVDKNATVLGWMNGGLAAGVGGHAESTVTGNTTLSIDGTGRDVEKLDEKDTIEAILNTVKSTGASAVGVLGGGTAVTTLGGTAEANVGGSTTITVHNASVIGLIGGGAAASVDATGVLEKVYKPGGEELQLGKDNGTSDIDGSQLDDLLQKAGILQGTETIVPDSLTIVATDIVNGGEATSNTGATNITLTGNGTAIGVLGGGVAAASHTYTWRNDGTNTDAKGYTTNDEYGVSKATATTGKSHITIALTGDENTDALLQGQLSGRGEALGVFGGGAAIAQSGNRQFYDTENKNEALSTTDGAFATAETAGSEINVVSGHVAGVFGGGIAAVDNNATATAAMTDTVDINIIGEDADVSGVVGNGLAYLTGKANQDKKNEGTDTPIKGQSLVSAKNTNINVQNGTVAGILGGGIAIDDTQADVTNATAETTGKATINVNGGTVKTVDMSDLSSVSYLDGITNAAGDAAIAAGGVALGGGAAANVAEAEVNINGGTVEGNIYGGGIAAYGWEKAGGSHVGTSTINLNGGTVNGDVYAGGAASSTELSGHTGYTHATATVDTAVINLAGTDVTGILYGTGKVSDGDTASATVGESTLNLIGVNTLAPVTGQSKIQNFTNVVATAGSETVINGLDAENTTALISGGKVTVEDGALLNVNSLSKDNNATYKIAAGTSDASTFWDDSDLIYDRMSGVYATTKVDQGTDDASDTSFSVIYQEIGENEKIANEAADSMADALGAQGLRGMFREGMNDKWQGLNEGSKSYLNDWQLADNKTPYQKGAMIGEDAAVTGNTVSIARDMADNVMQRLSFTDDYVQDAGWVNENGGIWAKYIHRTYDTDAMGSSMGGIHSSTDYDGAIVGVDFGKSGKFQSGVAFHYGSGDGHGLVSRNDYDAWGITMYGSMKDEAAGTNLMADIGWMTSDNDIDGTVEGKSMSADRDVDAWTIGLRGEKEYVFGRNQLVPYVGLRYMSVNPGSYTAYYNGQAAFNYDADNQNLWMLPIGVSFRNETVTAGGWRITPKVDLSYIWAFGDTDTDMTVNAGAYSDSLYYDVMDDSSWLASLGVEASKDVWSFGLGYGYQKGDDEKNRTWFVNASYAF